MTMVLITNSHTLLTPGQLLGDKRIDELCQVIDRCPLTSLLLGGNDIRDEGMIALSNVLRSLAHMKTLNLAANKFTDAGVQAILAEEVSPVELEALDLSRNLLTKASAFAIGTFFHQKSVKIESLYLGGKIGQNGWGDEFVRVLIRLVLMPGARPLKVLNYPEANMSHLGLAAVCSLIACSSDLVTLNISANEAMTRDTKAYLRLALRHNRSLQNLYVSRCYLTRAEKHTLREAVRSAFPLDWAERAHLGGICLIVIEGWSLC